MNSSQIYRTTLGVMFTLLLGIASTADAATITSTLSLGSSGTDVVTLQNILIQKGYFTYSATGYFGTRTQQAVIAFQKANGLAPVGSVGPRTRALLNAASSDSTPVAATTGVSSAALSSIPEGTPVADTGFGISIVAAGCATPTPPKHTFYIDPVNGTSTNDGSQAHPWGSLQEVLASKIADMRYVRPLTAATTSSAAARGYAIAPANAQGPVHPGDLIYLASGYYGSVFVTGINSDFIGIEAAPGQTPVFAMINVNGADKWIFRGLTVTGTDSASTSMPLVYMRNGTFGPNDNIVFDGNTVSSQPDVGSWTLAQWIALARPGILAMGADDPNTGCYTITHNAISNVATAVTFETNQSLFSHNTIDNFGNDGVDFRGSDIVLSHNTITNSNDLMTGLSLDGMQGQTMDTGWNSTNVLIDGNLIIRQTNPALRLSTFLQGIDAFDGDWTNLHVTNNIVITNAWHGISFASVHDGLFENNVVMQDAGTSTLAWITVGGKTHQGSDTSGTVIVRNNISSNLVVGDSGVTVDHNMAGRMQLLANGRATWFGAPYSAEGSVAGDHNTLNFHLPQLFVLFGTTTLQYDMRLASSSRAIGTGGVDAPASDFAENARSAPYDLGAYIFEATSTGL